MCLQALLKPLWKSFWATRALQGAPRGRPARIRYKSHDGYFSSSPFHAELLSGSPERLTRSWRAPRAATAPPGRGRSWGAQFPPSVPARRRRPRACAIAPRMRRRGSWAGPGAFCRGRRPGPAAASAPAGGSCPPPRLPFPFPVRRTQRKGDGGALARPPRRGPAAADLPVPPAADARLASGPGGNLAGPPRPPPPLLLLLLRLPRLLLRERKGGQLGAPCSPQPRGAAAMATELEPPAAGAVPGAAPLEAEEDEEHWLYGGRYRRPRPRSRASPRARGRGGVGVGGAMQSTGLSPAAPTAPRYGPSPGRERRGIAPLLCRRCTGTGRGVASRPSFLSGQALQLLGFGRRGWVIVRLTLTPWWKELNATLCYGLSFLIIQILRTQLMQVNPWARTGLGAAVSRKECRTLLKRLCPPGRLSSEGFYFFPSLEC